MEKRIIFGADELSREQTLELVRKIGSKTYAVKIHALYDQYGPQIIEDLLKAGAPKVWVDAKLHDTPKAVRFRARALASAGASIITLHTEGEIEMMIAAREGAPSAWILGVTVLTSLDEEQTHLLTGHAVKSAVLYRARLAKLGGLDGIVCSPQEVRMLARQPELKNILYVVPGTRSVGKVAGDQKRVMTPGDAIKEGATKLVIASQIGNAEDPAAEFDAIEKEIDAVLMAH